MEKINPFEYITQLEKENEKLKKENERLSSQAEKSQDHKDGLYIHHETDRSMPEYWAMKEQFNKDMSEYYLKRNLKILGIALVVCAIILFLMKIWSPR